MIRVTLNETQVLNGRENRTLNLTINSQVSCRCATHMSYHRLIF